MSLAIQSSSVVSRPLSRTAGPSTQRISDSKPFLPPPFIELPANVTAAEVEQFLREQRLMLLTELLDRNELEIPDRSVRGASPPPAYDRSGRRTNTIEQLVKAEMVAEHNRLIYQMTKVNANFTPPSSYTPPVFQKRIFLPLDQFPRHNLPGLVIGPRGSTLARLRADAGCEVSLRGLGSRGNRQSPEEAALPMHVFIEACSEQAVLHAISLVQPLIDPLHPEHELCRLRALEAVAAISGSSVQEVAGERQWRKLEGDYVAADEGEYQTADVVCALCGGHGHLTSDCRVGRDEFYKFLGEVGVSASTTPVGAGSGGSSAQLRFEGQDHLATLRQRIGAAQMTTELASNLNIKQQKGKFHPLSFQASAVAAKPAQPTSAAAATQPLVDVVSVPPWKRQKFDAGDPQHRR